MQDRASGILAHISSLPGKYGIGDLGPQAYRFADKLARARQSYWQVLPLNPPLWGLCPYSCLSAFAGNPLLISPELLYRDGLLTRRELSERPSFPAAKVDAGPVYSYKMRLQQAAYERFMAKPKQERHRAAPSSRDRQNKSWLDDYVLFVALREHFGGRSWRHWPIGLRDRRKSDLAEARRELKDAIEREEFLQRVFYRQWSSLKDHCNRQNIRVIGDIPIYVAGDSADVWAHPDIFKLKRTKEPKFVGGAPPDYFCRRGQVWGNPVYNWAALRKSNYSWWTERIEHNLRLFDVARLDHFLAFVAYWEIHAGRRTARTGKWVAGPGESFFDTLFKRVDPNSLVVEDLGDVSDDVYKLIDKYGLCGMRVLQYAFDPPGADYRANLHVPFNFRRNCVVYTGTHDNNTVKGWFKDEARAGQKKRLLDYLGGHVAAANIHEDLVRLAAGSVARLSIIPIQDVLGLGSRARMNVPGSDGDNWSWRLRAGQFNATQVRDLARMTEVYGRAPG